MLRSSKIEAIAEWHLSMATIFEFICYHMHVAGWLRKWPKWAMGSTSAAGLGGWHVRKSPDNVNIRWYRDLSGKKGMEFSVRKNRTGLHLLTRSRPNWIPAPRRKSGSARISVLRWIENSVSRWWQPNSEVYSQNDHFGLICETICQFLGMVTKNWYH